MLSTHHVIAFTSSTDLARSRAFYGDVLGLTLLEQTDFACVFDANGTMLRVTAVAEVAQPGYTVLGWQVTDIGATVTRLRSRGVAFTRFDGMDQDADGVWTTPNGDRVAWFHDPDGNVLSLTEFRDTPALVSDIQMRDIPDDVLAGVDARAARLGLSRVEYLRRRLAHDAAAAVPVTAADLRRVADSFPDPADPSVTSNAWSCDVSGINDADSSQSSNSAVHP